MCISRINRYLIVASLLIMVSPFVHAQDDIDDRPPLLELLDYVPDTEDNRRQVYFADMLVSAGTVSGVMSENGQDAWESIVGYPRVWVGWIPSALPPFNSYMFMMLEDEGESTGIRVETIERTVYFGLPSTDGMILQGDFDNEAIISAYTAETHELQNRDDEFILLCSVDGCDDGIWVNPANRNPANPFGGYLGRQEPIALLDELILNSPDIEIVDAMLDDDIQPLSQSEDYQALVWVASELGLIRQVAFFSRNDSSFYSLNTLDRILPSMEQALASQSSVADLQVQISPLPSFPLIMIAEVVDMDAETQTGLVLLPYEDEETANRALDAIQANLQSEDLVSLRTRQPYPMLMSERGELSFEVIYHEPTNHYLAVVALQSSLVKMPESDQDDMPEWTGLQFRLFMEMIISADTLWLVTDE